MSFTLPWTINAFVSTAINAANSITTAVFQPVSLLVNGNTELKSDTIINHLGVKKIPDPAYSLDVSGNANITGNILSNGTQLVYRDSNNNTGIGLTSLGTATVTGISNTGVGTNTFKALTSGSSNTTIGNNGLSKVTTGSFNVAIGSLSLLNDVSGSNNTAIGYYALNNCTADNNLAMGSFAQRYLTTGTDNTSIGTSTLVNSSFNGSRNTAIGKGIFGALTTGTDNTGVGYSIAPSLLTTGSSNTMIGANSTISGNYSNSSCLGAGSAITASNQIVLGTSSETTKIAGSLNVIGGIDASSSQTINFGTNAPTMSGASIGTGTIPTTAITGYGSGFATQTGANSFSALNTFTGGITASGTQTINFGSNAPAMSGASISATSIPNTALQSTVTINDTASTFSALKTFTGGIAASGTQTINFGTNAVAMSGASISATSIPNTALQSTVTINNTASTFSALKTFTGGIDASAAQTINFGSNAPAMSGASIVSGTIGQTQVSNGYVALSGAQTSIAGAKTFTTLPLSTDTTAPTSNNLIRKAYADVTYPVILNSINSLYGGSGAFNSGTSTANYCIALGTSALAVTTGGFNQAYGTNALLRCTTGAFNMAFGVNSLSNVTTGQSNMAIGTNSLPAGNCSESVGIGQSALQNSTAAPGRNTGIGAYVLQNTTSSSLCTAIGYNAGVGGILTGNNNTFIGASTSMAGDYSNSTVIGYNAQASTSNQITLGTSSETTRILGALTVAGSATFSTAPTMSGASISATSIPNTALQSTVTINDTASTFSALKTFTGGIAASGTQTITFGANNPTMGGSNITGIPTSGITNYGTFTGGITASGTQTITFGTNNPTMGGSNITGIPTSGITNYGTFTGGITASGTQTITFGTNAPTMSGANITAIPTSGITNYGTFTGGITASGTQTITFGANNPTMGGANITGIPTSGITNYGTFTGGITASGTQTITFGANNPTMGGANITGIPTSGITNYGTFTGGITASGTQTITFGTNAPTMSGANITAIPTSGITNYGTFTGGITASGTQTITFGTNAPTMSGANISATSIPNTALQSNVTLNDTTSTISALKTFTSQPIVQSQYVHSCSTPLTLTTTWDLSGSSPWYEFYPLNFYAGAGNVNLPTPASTTTGMRITFRRLGTSGISTITSNLGIYPNNSSTTTTVLFGINTWTVTIYCANLTASTYAWFFV